MEGQSRWTVSFKSEKRLAPLGLALRHCLLYFITSTRCLLWSFCLSLSVLFYLDTGHVDVWYESSVAWVASHPSLWLCGLWNLGLTSPCLYFSLLHSGNNSTFLRGCPEGEWVTNKHKMCLTCWMLSKCWSIIIVIITIYRWFHEFQEESSHSPSVVLVYSVTRWSAPSLPRWTCSRSSWALRVDSTFATFCGMASRHRRRFLQSKMLGEGFFLFFDILKSLFYFEFHIKERCILRRMRVWGQDFEDKTEC